MRIYECVRCGARFALKHVEEWGRHAASSGFGAKPCCTALRPALFAPKAPDGSVPNETCRGELVVTDVEAAEAKKVAPPVPIAP